MANNRKTTTEKIVVDYFSDVLCVWAWIGQPRVEELQKQWGEEIELRYRFVDVFGDARSKITGKYGAENGFEDFHEHIVHAASGFEAASIHPDTWTRIRPRSSLQAQLVLKAAQLLEQAEQAEHLALEIRRAFFARGEDIAELEVLLGLAESAGLDRQAIDGKLRDGAAIAALSSDLRMASGLGVKGSPTWVLNQGRQVLYGNVGYRILSANIEELLAKPGGDTSWC